MIPTLSLALVRAYNDWHIDEWCGAYPGRFIPMAVPVIWDVELTAEEVRRVAAKGCHSLSFTENPAALGYPSFHNEYWDPLWRACCDTGTVLSIHLGSSGRLSIPAVDSPPGRDDHAAAHEHSVRCGGPAVVSCSEGVPRSPPGPVRRRHGVGPVLPRTRRPHLRDAPHVDFAGLRRPPPERGLPRALPHLLHQRPCGSCHA